MNELESLIENANLPAQLKSYLSGSHSIQDELDETKLKVIEEFYLYYDSLYQFDKTEFSASVINSVKRRIDSDRYYYYLKKVLENNLDLKSKDKLYNCITIDNSDLLESEPMKTIFKKASVDFISLLANINKKEEPIDWNQIFIVLGKMELINELVVDVYYSELINIGNDIIEKNRV